MAARHARSFSCSALKAAAVKIKVLWGHYQAAKKAKKVFDWAAARVELSCVEDQYDALLSVPMKDRNPKYDLGEQA